MRSPRTLTQSIDSDAVETVPVGPDLEEAVLAFAEPLLAAFPQCHDIDKLRRLMASAAIHWDVPLEGG